MNQQPLKILVHKSEILASQDREEVIELAYVVLDILTEVRALPDIWCTLRRKAEAVTKRSSPRGISQFKIAYREAIAEYLKEFKHLDVEVINSKVDYSGRNAEFEYRIANPSYFSKDSTLSIKEEVESTEHKTIIEEDSSLYEERENEFRSRLKQPGSFRRSN